jgi:hypothetical protein
VALVALFSVLTVGFGAIAVASGVAGKWPITVGAALIALWMGSFARAALRRVRG